MSIQGSLDLVQRAKLPPSARAVAPETFAELEIARWLDGIDSLTVCAHDGLPLKAYRAGEPTSPPLLLINPIGVSVLLLAPLMRFLARRYFVLSWESRGLPSVSPHDDEVSLTVEDHIQDACTLLAQHGIAKADLVAFCSGTSIALPLLQRRAIGARKAVLISPSILIDGEVQMTNYQRTVIPIWNEVMTKGRDYCAIISNFMRAARPTPGDLVAEIDYVNRLPFIDGQSTYRYAKLHSHVNETRHSSVFSELPLPLLLVHAKDDELIHFDVSRFIGGRLSNCRHFVLDQGGHFAICTNEAMHLAIRDYLENPEATTNVGSLS